jgi:hypothetical protein
MVVTAFRKPPVILNSNTETLFKMVIAAFRKPPVILISNTVTSSKIFQHHCQFMEHFTKSKTAS